MNTTTQALASPTTFKARCTSKVMGGMPPPGTATAEMVSATLQVVESSLASLTGSITLSYALGDDQIQIGNYYDLTIAAGTAPARK